MEAKANIIIYINLFCSKIVTILKNKIILLVIAPKTNSFSKVENKINGIIAGISYQCPKRNFEIGKSDFFNLLQKSIANAATTKRSNAYIKFFCIIDKLG